MIAEVFPQFQFIHVIRDGRDMATAGNQLQRDKHAAALFGAADGDPRVTAARLWAKANSQAADWAARPDAWPLSPGDFRNALPRAGN